MSVETSSFFAQVIQDHLELKRRNAELEEEMPLERYMSEDPFDNHPLFKSEEQARVEETMSGQDSIVEEPTSLDWPVDDTFVEPPAVDPDAGSESEESGLWSRSRDFDWGD
ncbi:MAG TPA: hypothetical protein VIU44_01940 [Gaiellaceae bacterium]